MDPKNLDKLIVAGKGCGYDMKELIPGKFWGLTEFRNTLGKVLPHEDIIAHEKTRNPEFFKALDESGVLVEIVQVDKDEYPSLVMLTAEMKKAWDGL